VVIGVRVSPCYDEERSLARALSRSAVFSAAIIASKMAQDVPDPTIASNLRLCSLQTM
jgi:hypothetical protein